jgi:hypothetical protein
MSAIYRESIATRVLPNGLVEFTGAGANRPITDWTVSGDEKPAQVRIPKQRAGSLRDAVVLAGKDQTWTS